MRRSLFRAVLPVLAVVLGGTALAKGADDARERAVMEAVFRQQIQEHLDAPERARGTVVCLGVDPGGAEQTPDRDFMSRFGADKAVRRLAECERRPAGAVEILTSRPAVIVTAGPIEWIADDEAWVTVTYYRTKLLSAERCYRVVREPAGWVSLGPILKDGPA